MKKPLYKRWYFWLGLIIFLVFVFPIFIGIASEFMDGWNRAGSVISDDSTKTEQVEQKANPYEKNWKKKLIKTKNGSFKIDKIFMATGNDEGKEWKELVMIGTYTNTSHEAEMACEYVSDRFDMTTTYKNTDVDIGISARALPGYDELYDNASKKLLRGQSIKCLVGFGPLGNISQKSMGSKIKIRILDDRLDTRYNTVIKPKIVKFQNN